MSPAAPFRHPFDLLAGLLRAWLAAEQAPEALRAALPRTPRAWATVVAVASRNHVLMPFAAVIEALAVAPLLDAELRAFLATLRTANRQRNLALRRQLGEIVALLNGVGIEPVLLKGAIRLVDDLYPDPGWRMLGDIDLLVPPERRAAAQAALAAGGYALAAGGRDGEPSYAGHHHAPPLRRDDRPAPVEIHSALFPSRGQRRLLPAGLMLAMARPVTVDGARARLPCVAHQLVHLIGHGQLTDHGYLCGCIPLRDRLEAAALSGRMTADTDWAVVRQRFAMAGYGRPLATFLLALGDGGLHPAPPSPDAGPLVRLQARRVAWQARSGLPVEPGLRLLWRVARDLGGLGLPPRAWRAQVTG